MTAGRNLARRRRTAAVGTLVALAAAGTAAGVLVARDGTDAGRPAAAVRDGTDGARTGGGTRGDASRGRAGDGTRGDASRDGAGDGTRRDASPGRDPAGDRGRTGSGTPGPSAADASAATRARLARLGPERLAGETVIMRYAGTTVPGYVRRALADGRAAGVILFSDNVPDAATTRRVTRVLRRAGGGDAVVCLDQEGGSVRVLGFAPPATGQRAQPSPAAAGRDARRAGRRLAALGVTVTLAPVADVGRPGSALLARTFPGDTAATARFVAAAVRGYRGTGVAPTVKHFPGLGAARANTDDEPVDVDRSAAALGREDLPPFRAAIAAGAPAIMVSHARYPALDADHIASRSRTIVTGLLKHRLGFRGVVMTDSLEAAAARSAGDPGAAAVGSVAAGVDLVLTTGPGSHIRVLRALAARARASRGFRARLRDAAARVRRLR